MRTENVINENSVPVFVKRARMLNESNSQLKCEVKNSKFVNKQTHPEYGKVSPKIIHSDNTSIVFESLLDYKSLDIYLTCNSNNSSKQKFARLQQIGRILSYIHSWKYSSLAHPEFPSSFPLKIDNYNRINPSSLEVLKRLKPETHVAINKLNNKSKTETKYFIHGDFKPDNIMICNNDVKFVDWELSGTGHPAHDIASFYVGMFTTSLNNGLSENKNKIDSKQVLANAVLTAVSSTRNLIAGYVEGGAYSIFKHLTQIIGAKFIVRSAMLNYLSQGQSPLVSVLLQTGETCLLYPKHLTKLLRVNNV